VDSARRTVQSQLRTYATQIEQAAVPAGRFPDPLPASTLDPAAQAQVQDADGRVVAATRTLAGLPAVYTLPAGSGTPVRQKAADGAIPGEVTVYGERTTVGGQAVTIITGTATTLRGQVNETFARLLLIGLPTVLVLACATVWWVAGRALRPVEEIRRAVTDITDITDLSGGSGGSGVSTASAASTATTASAASATASARRVPEPGTDDEIGRLAETMNAMLARLQDSAERQRRFVSDASHELRSPLTAIRTSLEVGLAHPEQAPWPAIAERAVRQTVRLEELISDLLQLAKTDAGQAAARRQRVELAPLFAELRSSTTVTRADVPGASAVAIELAVPTGLAVTGNPAELSRVFRNVLDNAVRHAKSAVRISATPTNTGPDTSIRILVADDGPGIPAEERERVFDRFVRLDASREHASGSTGLGLAIAKEIVLAHAGTIAVGATAEGGALVVITLRGHS
jgi:signal transduction histidine kinase